MMNVHVRLAEPFWRLAGQRDLEVDIQNGACLADLLAALAARYPALASGLRETPPQVFVGDAEAAGETVLEPGARVHVVWPVAGG